MTRRRHPGFSLFEVLVAIAILVTLLSSIFGVLFELGDVRRRVVARSAQLEDSTQLIEWIERAVLTCVLEGPAGDAGFSGDATSMRIIARECLADVEDADGWAIGAHRLSVSFEPTGGTIMMGQSPAVGLSSSDDASSGLPSTGVFGDIRFRYHDGEAWRESFDSVRAGRLPRAVEVAIWFDPWRTRPEDVLFGGESLEDIMPERSTFDATGGFDERAFAFESDAAIDEPPVPDRLRVLVVPDAEPDDGPIADERFSSEAGVE